MKEIYKKTAILALGILIGSMSAFKVISTGWGFDINENNGWRMHQNLGNLGLSMHAKAYLRQSGHLPLPQDQALYFFTYNDSDGRSLNADCDYLVTGDDVGAFWWSLSAHDKNFVKFENPSLRYSFNMSNIIRKNDGTYKLTISGKVKTGNWLPLSQEAYEGGGGFMLSLRLYGLDKVMSEQADQLKLPHIQNLGCR